MPRWNFCNTAGVGFAMALIVALAGGLPARTQTAPAPAIPLTPAQQKAQAAKEARQAAAEKAAENRAAAAQNRINAAQSRAAAAHNKNATANSNGAQAGAGANTGSGVLGGTANSLATGPSAVSAARTGGVSPASASTAATAVGSGTLAWQTRLYTSTGCVHEGNSAVCTFTFANQGNAATLVAGSEMAGIQLVDDAHVPHRAQSAHFLDKYGTQQPRLVVQPGDSGTYVLTFANVNSQVTSADFHLRQQIVGGVTFSGGTSATPAANPAATPVAKKP